jgi:hypothetical protein
VFFPKYYGRSVVAAGESMVINDADIPLIQLARGQRR